MNKFFISGLVLTLFVFGPGLAKADTASTSEPAPTSTPVSTITPPTTSWTELESLLQQMRVLREKIITALIQNLSTVQTRGEKIALLQSMLSEDKSIYPEGAITGNLGNLTKKAIIRFINKNSLKVSSSTNDVLRGPARLLTDGAGNSGQVPPGLLTAPGIAKKLGATSSATSSRPQGKWFVNTIKNLFGGR